MTKLYMLDTDICSYVIKKFNDSVVCKYDVYLDSCCISAATYGELLFWSMKKAPSQLSKSINILLDQLQVVPMDNDVMQKYATIRLELECLGTPLANMDILIAASAMASGATLVSHNTRHFAKIKDLKIEDWC